MTSPLLYYILGIITGFLCNLFFFYLWKRIKNPVLRTQEEEKHFTQIQALLEAMPDMAVVFNKDLEIERFVNVQLPILFDIPIEELIGVHIVDVGKKHEHFREGSQTIADNLILTLRDREARSFDYAVEMEDRVFYGQAYTSLYQEDQIICFTHDVTQEVKQEKEILWLKSFLQEVIDHLPIGVFVKDVNDGFRLLFHNQKALLYTGNENRTLQDFETTDIEQIDDETARREDEEVARSGEARTFERAQFCEDSDVPIRWGTTTKTLISNEEVGAYIVAAMIDTTALQQKQFELEKTKRELSFAMEAGDISAWYYTVETDKVESLFHRVIPEGGITLEQLISIIHPKFQAACRSDLYALIRGDMEKRKVEIPMLTPGGYFWQEITIMHIKDEEGRVVQLIGTQMSIDDKVKRQQELEETKSKLELAFTSAQIAPWEYDVETRMFDLLSPEDLKRSIKPSYEEFSSYLHEEDLPLYQQVISSLAEGKNEAVTIQLRMQLPGDAEYRWYENHAVVSKLDDNGNVKRVMGLRRDITALKFTDELIELRNQAEESNRLKSAFLANMSHEIRTPLNAIVGFSNLIIESVDDPELMEYFRIIENNTDLLLQLINDILDLSKIEAGQLDFNFTDFDLHAVFAELHQVYNQRIYEGVELICELPERNCIIHSEKIRLTQVVSNFLSNACKFTTTGSIRMGYSHTADGLRFSVTDTGKGIDPENVDNVFARFAKFDSFVQGTGLGLSICKTIVEYLGGEIGVSSELGKGSEFWFTIPCEPTFIS